jgi:hypothetical protein
MDAWIAALDRALGPLNSPPEAQAMTNTGGERARKVAPARSLARPRHNGHRGAQRVGVRALRLVSGGGLITQP